MTLAQIKADHRVQEVRNYDPAQSNEDIKFGEGIKYELILRDGWCVPGSIFLCRTVKEMADILKGTRG